MLLLYRQLELARAKAVVKIAELTKEYESVSKDVFYNACDTQEDGLQITASFNDRLCFENFCKNIDTLHIEITNLTKRNTILKEDILHVIRNCRHLHTNSAMDNRYIDGKWLKYEINTPLASQCPVFSDAGLVLLNEWESRLDNSHQRLHLEGHKFVLDEFFRHLLPDVNPSDFILEEDKPEKSKAANTTVLPSVETPEAEDDDEYLCGPVATPLYRLVHIRLKRSVLQGKSGRLITGLLLGVALMFVGTVVLHEHNKTSTENYIPYEEPAGSKSSNDSYGKLYSIMGKGNNDKERIIQLEQEVQSLKEQVYVLQQASGKHDNALHDLGMAER